MMRMMNRLLVAALVAANALFQGCGCRKDKTNQTGYWVNCVSVKNEDAEIVRISYTPKVVGSIGWGLTWGGDVTFPREISVPARCQLVVKCSHGETYQIDYKDKEAERAGERFKEGQSVAIKIQDRWQIKYASGKPVEPSEAFCTLKHEFLGLAQSP